jgi:signal peptidase II
MEVKMKVWSRLLPPMIAVLVLDLSSKLWAEQSLVPHEPVPVIGQYFRLTLGYNTGVAFGLFANGGDWPLYVTGIIILGLTVWLSKGLYSGEFPPRSGWLMGMLLGGAVANFGDRLWDGRVTDFLDAGVGPARWPTFNLADSFIVVSLMMLMWLSFTWNGPPEKEERSEQPENSFPEGESSL